ncbi:MAG: triose-phosphate isomerase [Beijerinckiaceae bacterium]|nr:triose-phosphate isomerase [Beijerinckiaceae bacterium]
MAEKICPLVAGNWKMNGKRDSLGEVTSICKAVAAGGAGNAEILICPPATLLMAVAELCEGTPLSIGGQDCHAEASGAFTGDISAEMLKDAGASYVILGHSERRAGHQESNEVVRWKAEAALRAGLTPIICVGETISEREDGEAMAVVGAQLAGSVPQDLRRGRIVIAYEPIWAIGTGLTPSQKDVAEIHGFIREKVRGLVPGQGTAMRILYGGSVKPANAAKLLSAEDVDGALVGGASLSSAAFMEIAGCYR